jgi:hypothetical protein
MKGRVKMNVGRWDGTMRKKKKKYMSKMYRKKRKKS